MNTKLFLAAIVALILLLSHSYKPSSVIPAPFSTETGHTGKSPVTAHDWSFILDHSSAGQHSEHQSHCESFHYDRFRRRRGCLLFIFAIKLLLLVLHCATLIGASLHLLH